VILKNITPRTKVNLSFQLNFCVSIFAFLFLHFSLFVSIYNSSIDDGGASTEERQRADEDDGEAAKEPSGTTRTEDATNGGSDA
jgi:hypothetical protein